MKCFIHSNNDAVGICKSCQKALCASCAVDTGRGLACPGNCVDEVSDLNKIVDKSKRIYSIGTSSKLPPTGIIMYMFFGVMFTGFGIYRYFERGRFDAFTTLLGLGFVAMGIITYIRNKQLNLNC